MNSTPAATKTASILLLALLPAFSNQAFSQAKPFTIITDSVTLRKENDLLIKDFEKRVRKINGSVELKGLRTVVKDSLFAGYYLFKTNSIYLSTWPAQPKVIKNFCTGIMGSKAAGEKLAAMYFYGFFLPHEIGHGLQFNANVRKGNEYDNEYEANVIALLYWKERGKEKELRECYEIAKQVVAKLPNPIPANEDTKQYFTVHYDEMSQNAGQYAYMLFSQIVTIFEDKSLPDFNTYIKQYVAKKPGR